MNDIVLLNLRISMWGVSRVLPDQQYEVDADRAMVRATKKILECPEYEFLLQLKRSIHRRLRTLALPGEILRAGVYPISVAMVQAIETTLEDFSVRWGVGVLGLEQVWDLRVREIEDRLRALYDEADYPSWERVRGCFNVRWNYFTMNTPQFEFRRFRRVGPVFCGRDFGDAAQRVSCLACGEDRIGASHPARLTSSVSWVSQVFSRQRFGARSRLCSS
jgi:hypothetical protein